MPLWVDKHRPKQLKDLDYHHELSAQLQRMVDGSRDFPHAMIYGPSGAGKKTRVMALLRELQGPSVEKLRVEQRTFKFGNSAPVELTLVSSSQHIELNPSDAGIRDREVVQEVIKEIAQSAPVIARAAAADAPSGEKPPAQFKVVVLNEVERLSKPAQHALRRTMEKYVGTCRLLLCCVNPSKVRVASASQPERVCSACHHASCLLPASLLASQAPTVIFWCASPLGGVQVIAPIRSRCVCLRVAAPTHEEVCTVLDKVCQKEGIKLPPALALKIARQSDRNMRRAILALEACKLQQFPFSDNQMVQLPDWQLFVRALADDILTEQSPKQLLKVRGKLYDLLANCIPPDLILRALMQDLLRKVPLGVKHEAVHHAAMYECRMQGGSKPIFHLEACIAKLMSIYKKHLLSNF